MKKIVLMIPKCRVSKKKKKSNRKKTHEEYVAELKVKNPNVVPLEKYLGANTKIKHKCLLHNEEWYIAPSKVIHGVGCKYCCKNFRWDDVSYKDYVHKTYPNIEVIGTYINMKIPIEHRCILHDYIWNAIPSSIMNGSGCKYCGNEKISQKNLLKREVFISRVNDSIILLEEYKNMNTNVDVMCRICGYKWSANPKSLSQGCGCPKCGVKKQVKSRTKSHDEYLVQLFESNIEIVPIEKYINNSTNILHQCNTCQHIWSARPGNILQGRGCPMCKRKNLREQKRMSNKEFTARLHERHPDIVATENYINFVTPIGFKCLLDGCEWKTTPAHIFTNSGCPTCHESQGETIIRNWLNKNNLLYDRQYKFDRCKDQRSLPFDFYVSSHNLLIEYDGKQHFEPVDYFGGKDAFKILQLHDKIKTEYCKDNNINLLRINYMQDIEAELNNYFN